MNEVTLTCPFTGITFNAFENDNGDLIAENVISGEKIVMKYDDWYSTYKIKKKTFKPVETISCSEACEILNVSRARISQIVKDDVIPHFTVNGKHRFKKEDIIRYRDSRTVGRPTKAG